MATRDKAFLIAQYCIAVGSLVLLILLTVFNQNPPLFDEVLFLGNMGLYEQYGLSEKFLTEMYDQAPGPLYQFVHTFFKPLTHLQTPGIRLVNVFLFIGIIAVLALFFNQGNRFLIYDYKLAALNLVAVPVVWQSAGMALTEIPAMFFSALFLLTLWKSFYGFESVSTKLWMSLFTGVVLGLSILGRTPYLVLIPALVVFFIDFNNFKINFSKPTFLPILVIGVVAALICLPIFIIWEGLVPPAQRLVSEGDLQLWHGVLAFAYAGLITLLINPSWFTFDKRILWVALLGYVVFFLMNVFWFDVSYGPLSAFVGKVLPEGLFAFYPKSIAPVLMVFSLYFVWNLFTHMRKNKGNVFYLYIALSLVLLLLSCVSVKHLFSSRYVAQASVFLIIIISEKDKIDLKKCVRTLVGVAIGIVSLSTYVNP